MAGREGGVIPESLRAEPRWLVWKYNAERKKIPYQPARPDHEAKINDERHRSDFATAQAVVDAGKADGTGFVLGDGFAGVDLDCVRDPQTGALTPAAQAIVKALDSYTEISPSGTGVKVFLKAWLGKNHVRAGLEIYGGRRYFCVTGLHLAETPAEPQERGEALTKLIEAEFGSREEDDAEDEGQESGVEFDLGDDTELIDGARNNALARIGGYLRRGGLNDEEMLAAMRAINRKRCKPPLGNNEVEAIAKSISRYAPSKAERAIGWMNERHAVLNENGKAVIITERRDPVLDRLVIDRSSPADIRLLYCTNMVRLRTPAGKRADKPLGDYWLTNAGRRKYDSLIFDPEGQHLPEVYNLWRGFHVKPAPGSWDLLREHLHTIICNGNDARFNFFYGWMARAVQKPGRPAETALVMRGEQGAGKGVLARSLGHIFGQHFVHVSNTHHLTGHFNAHLQDAVLVFGDEAVWGGDKQGEGTLKALITEPTLAIERKGRDAYIVKNVIHLILASNSDWVAPVGLGDRRFCIVDVPDTKIGDHAYFKKIREQLEHGGYEAMLHDLLAYDLSKFDHRKPPKTDAALDQKLRGMSPIQRWWFERLQAGVIAPQFPWPANRDLEIPKATVHDNYIQAMDRARVDRRAMESELGRALNKLVPGWESPDAGREVRRRRGHERVLHWVFPGLTRCRTHFAESVVKQPVQWSAAPEDGDLDFDEREAA